MTNRRCGTCRWWQERTEAGLDENDDVWRHRYRTCMWPAPVSVVLPQSPPEVPPDHPPCAMWEAVP